jgi:hypothetical protein
VIQSFECNMRAAALPAKPMNDAQILRENQKAGRAGAEISRPREIRRLFAGDRRPTVIAAGVK